MLKTLKFSSESIQCAEDFRTIAQIIKDQKSQLTVVCALAQTEELLAAIMDDELLKIELLELRYRRVIDELLVNNKAKAYEVLNEVFTTIRTSKSRVKILNQGEILTSEIFSLYCMEIGLNVGLLYAYDFVHTDVEGMGRVDNLMLRPDMYYITQASVCQNEQGEQARFGIGGADYSATLLGVATGSSEVQIWDRSGVMYTGDKAIVPEVRPVEQLSYSQAAEMAYFGDHILYPAVILPCRLAAIDVSLCDFEKPTAAPTKITAQDNPHNFLASAARDNITLIRITSDRMLMNYGFLRKVLHVFERFETSVDMVTTSEIGIAITIDDLHAITEIESSLKEFGDTEVEHSHTIVCVVGNMSYGSGGVAQRLFDTINKTPIKMISYGASHRSISLLIEMKHKDELLQNINKLF